MTKVMSFIRATGQKIKMIAMMIADLAYSIWFQLFPPKGE